MTTPVLLIGLTLLLWGWQSGHPWLGALLALLPEGARLVSRRWFFSPADFRRVVILCNLLLALLVVYGVSQAAHQHSGKIVHLMIQWLPLALYPLLLVQAYGTEKQIAIRSLMLVKNAFSSGSDTSPPVVINLAWPYWCICLLAASVIPDAPSPWFYPGCCLLACMALWGVKPLNIKRFTWVLVLAFVTGAGLLGHIGLHRLQGSVEDQVTRLFQGSGSGKEEDASRSRTAFGRIGSLKLSDKIVLRVTGSGLTLPLLLREAAYTTLIDTTWVACEQSFQAVRPGQQPASWQFGQTSGTEKLIRITASRDGAKGLLALPSGVTRITGLTADELLRSRLGSVTIHGGPAISSYQTAFTPQADSSGPPNDLDLQVPARIKPALSQIVSELKLAGQPAEEVAGRLSDYFNRQFRYTTVQGMRDAGSTPLEDFLLKTRAGHCEYFASATVLLARHAGIPARYVTGYSVQEFSPWEHAYVARQRHAHAWCQIFINGSWRDLDTTPAIWYSQEQSGSSQLRFFSDLVNWSMFRLAALREKVQISGAGRYGIWLPMLLLLYPACKLLRGIRRKAVEKAAASGVSTAPLPGHDSEWYLLEKELARNGFERHSWEPVTDWLERVGEDLPASVSKADLVRLVELHYRYRFDPLGISEQEREALRLVFRAASNLASR